MQKRFLTEKSFIEKNRIVLVREQKLVRTHRGWDSHQFFLNTDANDSAIGI